MATNAPHRDNATLVPSSAAWFDAQGIQDRPVVNPSKGGQYGWAPDTYAYVSEHPHVQQQTWCVLLSSPAFFSKLPAGQMFHSLCKSWFETRSREISGISERIEVEFAEQRFSGRTMAVPSGGTRTLGQISHQGVDPEGEVFTKLFRTWVLYGLNDPDLGHPRLVTLDDPGDMLIDQISASMIYFEPTRNMRDIAHAALVVGAMPRNTVEIQMRRNREESGQMRDINMEFTGLIDFDTEAAIGIARSMLSRMSTFNPSARVAPAGFSTPTSVLSSLTDTGVLNQLATQASRVSNPDYLG